MEQDKAKDIQDIFLDAKEYLETRLEHTKLSIVEKGAKIFADLITNAVVITFFILAFLFGTFTLALFLSEVLGSFTKGFGCVAVIYLAMAIIVYLVKDKFIEPSLINLFIKRYFDKVADKENDDEDK